VINEKWYYNDGENTIGPFSRDVLGQLLEKSILTPSTLVWLEGTKGWVRLSTCFPERPQNPRPAFPPLTVFNESAQPKLNTLVVDKSARLEKANGRSDNRRPRIGAPESDARSNAWRYQDDGSAAQASVVKRYWWLLIAVYAVSVVLAAAIRNDVNYISGFSYSIGLMTVPTGICALILRLTKSQRGARNSHIALILLLSYFVWEQVRSAREDFNSSFTSGCLNNNTAIAAMLPEEGERSKYCSCIAEGIEDEFIFDFALAYLTSQRRDGSAMTPSEESLVETVSQQCMSTL